MSTFKLLLVDDNSRSLKLLEAICQTEGYTTVLANDGQVAMEILVHQPIDLVITDILMPNVDGYYLCYKIRNHERLRDIPIIIYTATYTSASEKKIAEEMGADLFIRKPASIQVLASAIDTLLKAPPSHSQFPPQVQGSFEVMHQYSSDLVNKLEQRNIALEEIRQNLEHKVYERTQELQAVNEELLASNEELKAANEELSAINDKLSEATQLIQQQSEVIVKQKDEQLNRVLESSDHFIWSFDLTGSGQNYMSRSVERILGESPESILKKRDDFWKSIYPPDLEKWNAARERLWLTGQAEETYRLIDRHGKLRWLNTKYWIIKDKDSIPQRMDGISSDITQIKEAERALQNERMLMRSLIDNIPDFIFVKDMQFRHVLNNKANVELFGAASEKETLGKSLVDYFGEAASPYLEDDRFVVTSGQPIINKEETITTSEGQVATLLTTKVPLRDEDGNITGLAGISRDITEHKKHQQALVQYQENLDIIFSSTQEEILLLDRQGKVVLFNAALETFLKKTTGKKPVVGEYVWDITIPERKEVAKKLFTRVLDGESIFTEAVIHTDEGLVVHELHYEPITIEGVIKYVSLISVDITARRKGEGELTQSRYLLGKAYEVAQIGYWSFDPATNHREWNNQARQIFGLPADFDATFDGYLAITHPEEKEYVMKMAQQTQAERKSYSIEHRIIRPADGAVRWVHEQADFVTREDNSILLIGIVQDITERKKTEQELKSLHDQLLFHIENTPLGFIEWDNELKVKSWSNQALEIFGWTEKEFIENGKTGFSRIYDKDFSWVNDVTEQLVNGTMERNKIQFRNLKKDGTIVWCEWFNSIMRDPDGRVITIMSLVQDITERKAMEDVLVEYNERYEILSKGTNDAIWDWDIKTDFVIWNHGLETIFGYSVRQIDSVKAWWKAKVHPADHPRVIQEIENAFSEQRANWTSQYQYLCADGTYKHVLDRAYIIYHNNTPVRVIGAMQDITSQKEFERNITSIARELSELIEYANTPIFGTDRNRYINEWNKVTEQLTGYTKNEVLGKDLLLFIKGDQENSFGNILTQVTRDEPLSNLEIPLKTKDDKELIILLNATPRRNALQQITGALMVGQNITELIEYRQNLEIKVKERTRELNEALQKEKELVEMKSKFVSIASHEFRTPLSTIALVSGFLKKHRDKISPDEFNLKLQSIEKQVSHMTYLLDDILMIGKSEAGKIKTQYAKINLASFFNQTVREVEASAKTHSIKMRLKTNLKEFNSDEKLLRNIIINLLTNAIKFSPGAKYVEFRISDSHHQITLEVEDKGIGITEEDRANIFTSFFRGSNVGTIQGTGLGLSIVKKAVDLLSGEIKISSKPGHGTLFTVTLPLTV